MADKTTGAIVVPDWFRRVADPIRGTPLSKKLSIHDIRTLCVPLVAELAAETARADKAERAKQTVLDTALMQHVKDCERIAELEGLLREEHHNCVYYMGVTPDPDTWLFRVGEALCRDEDPPEQESE